jgi:cytosine/adenosine deaminase-related metal-dependent hydrolase
VARAGVEENRRFATARRADPRVRGLIGAHASFTVGDATLDALAGLCHETGAGLHVHLLEDAADRRISEAAYGAGPVERLRARGLLTPRTLVGHGVHLTPAEAALLTETETWLAHNPRSNMNNRVGATPLHTLGPRVLLGTDGIDGDILAEARAAFFRGREHQTPVDGRRVARMLGGAQTFLGAAFGESLGTLAVGAPADLTLLDYDPPTPMTTENVLGHLLFGWGAHLVRSVLVAGRFVYRDRRFPHLDPAAAAERTRAAAARLWKAYVA